MMMSLPCTRDTAMPPIMDAERTRVLWARQQPGRYPSFFEQLGERCQQIEAVAMDMNTAFDLEVNTACRRRWSTTCSRMVARYGREVVDRVRVEQAKCTEKR